MYYFVLKSKTGTPQGFLDYEWNFTLSVSEAMNFETIKEAEEWLDEAWEEDDAPTGFPPRVDWRIVLKIQKVFSNTIP